MDASSTQLQFAEFCMQTEPGWSRLGKSSFQLVTSALQSSISVLLIDLLSYSIDRNIIIDKTPAIG
jgi:hypothetical protein